MPTIAPAGLVAGAARIPLPYGLFSTFILRAAGTDRWESGASWQRLICDPAQGIGQQDCDDQTPTIGLPKNLARNGQGDDLATPFIVYGHFSCFPTGYTVERAQDLATVHLLAREEARVEQAFWTGDLGNNPHLADATETVTIGAAAVSLELGLSLLENYNAGSYGSVGVIHMTRGTALAALGENLLESVGNGTRLQTKLGTPVAAGAGYPGTGPTGGAPVAGKPWIYISPAVFGYRSEVMNSSSTPGDLFDRSVNNLTAIAERRYLLGYDGCGVGAVQVDLALP